MKMKFFCFVLLSFTSVFVFSQTKITKEITTLINKQQLAWNEGNINEFMKYYWNNDSLIFIGSKGITYGWQNTLNNYKKNYPNKEAMGILSFTIIKVDELSKNSVYVIGKWELKKDKPAGGHFTLLWKKISKNWVIVSDHTS